MSHIESFSVHPEKDKKLIEWLAKQHSKSSAIKKALYLYMELGQVLDLNSLAEKLNELPVILDTLARIEEKLSNGQFALVSNGDVAPSVEGVDEDTARDMMDLMDGF